MVITEKIDGTNAGIQIVPWSNLVMETSQGWNWSESYYRQWGRQKEFLISVVGSPVPGEFNGSNWTDYGPDAFAVFAQSRNRLIAPGNDNAGFAAWVERNAEALVNALGEGTHFGEWYGEGIQKNPLKIQGKRFALFNTHRWAGADFASLGLPEVETVPVLYQGPFSTDVVSRYIDFLKSNGSQVEGSGEDAEAEGVVVFHAASRQVFKVLCDSDYMPKTVRDAA